MTKKKDYNMKESISSVHEPFVPYVTGSVSNIDILSSIQSARKGLTLSQVINLSAQLGISTQQLARILHVSLRSLQRYEPSKILDSDISATAILLERIYTFGVEVFGDSDSLSQWLHSSIPALEGQRPIDYLDTSFGFQLVEQMLGRIKHGVFA